MVKSGSCKYRWQYPGDSSEANDAVKELREGLIPMSGLPEGVLIGGATAINVAFFDLVSMWTPIVIGIVLALSFVLLLFVFRSISRSSGRRYS